MEQKFYQLVAWTDREQVRIIPGIFYQIEEPYLDEIDAFAKGGAFRQGEVRRRLRLSRAYEAYGDFLLRCGMRREAFDQYAEAARACLNASRSCRHSQPLRHRFYAMYDRCRELTRQELRLQPKLVSSGLARDCRTVAEEGRNAG